MTSRTIDTEGIAALLGLTRQHVTDRLTKRRDFPRPVIDLSRRTRRWREAAAGDHCGAAAFRPSPPRPVSAARAAS